MEKDTKPLSMYFETSEGALTGAESTCGFEQEPAPANATKQSAAANIVLGKDGK
jgi:hypothetical protein